MDDDTKSLEPSREGNEDSEYRLDYQEITFATLLHMKDRYSTKFDRVIADGLDEINRSLSEFKLGIEEIGRAIGEISQATEDIASASQEQKDLAAAMASMLGEADASSAVGHEHLERLDGRMSALQASSADIGALVRNVDDIAETLNILSINGSIQAARSGASGRGFSIVTGEMRKLASSVKESATRQMGAIDTVIRLIGESAEMSGSIKGITESNRASMSRTGEKVAGLRAQLDLVAASCQQLAASVREFSATIEEISRNIAGIEAMIRRISETFSSSTRFDQAVTETCGECAALAGGSSSIEEAAGKQMGLFLERMGSREREGERALARAQLYLSLPWSRIPDRVRREARGARAEPLPADRCLCLMGAAGPLGSGGEALDSKCFRLPDGEPGLEGAPLLRRILADIGISFEAIARPKPRSIEKMGGFSLVEDLAASPLPADKEFLRQAGIASLMAAGGVLVSGDAFFIVLWSRDRIDQESAEALSVMGPSFQLGLKALAGAGRYWA